MFDFNKPKIQITEMSDDKRYGKFVVEPLERGYGITLGNSLRRIMLSSLPGAAVSQVKIDGVLHEFSSIPGVKEDVTEIIMNLKNLAIKNVSDSNEPKTAYIEFEGEQTDDDKYIPKTMSIKFKNPYLQDFLAKWATMTQYLNSMKNALPSVKSSIELPDGSDSVQEAVRKNINEQYLSFKNLYSINSKSNVVVKKGTDGIKVRISNNDKDNK